MAARVARAKTYGIGFAQCVLLADFPLMIAPPFDFFKPHGVLFHKPATKRPWRGPIAG